MLTKSQREVLSKIGMLDFPDIEEIVRYAGDDLHPFIGYLIYLRTQEDRKNRGEIETYNPNILPQDVELAVKVFVRGGRLYRYNFEKGTAKIGRDFYFKDGDFHTVGTNEYIMDGILISEFDKNGRTDIELTPIIEAYAPMIKVLKNEISGKHPRLKKEGQNRQILCIRANKGDIKETKIAVIENGRLVALHLPTTKRLLNGQLDFLPFCRKISAPNLETADDYTFSDAPKLAEYYFPKLQKVGYYFFRATPQIYTPFPRKPHPLKKIKGERFYKELKKLGVADIPNIVDIVKYAGWEVEPLSRLLRPLIAQNYNRKINGKHFSYASKKEALQDVLHLLDKAGYNAFHATTEEEKNKIKKYFRKGEEICTFDDPTRHLTHFIIHCVKKNAEEIQPSPTPIRDDAYGTSVISIQIRDGFISIKNRYNDNVAAGDSTFDNDPERIIPGLSGALKAATGYDFNSDAAYPEGFLVFQGKILRYHSEGNGIFVGENFYFKNKEIHEIHSSHQYLMGAYLWDTETKKVQCLTNAEQSDEFIRVLERELIGKQINIKIKSERDESGKILSVKRELYADDALIAVTDRGRLTTLYLPTTTKIRDNFLTKAPSLQTIRAPHVKVFGNNGLSDVPHLVTADFPALETAGFGFLRYPKSLRLFEAENLLLLEENSLETPQCLERVRLPKLKKTKSHVLSIVPQLVSIVAGEVEEWGDGCLQKADNLISAILPKTKKMGSDCLSYAPKLISLHAPETEELGIHCLQKTALSRLDMPQLKRVGTVLLSKTPSIQSFETGDFAPYRNQSYQDTSVYLLFDFSDEHRYALRLADNQVIGLTERARQDAFIAVLQQELNGKNIKIQRRFVQGSDWEVPSEAVVVNADEKPILNLCNHHVISLCLPTTTSLPDQFLTEAGSLQAVSAPEVVMVGNQVFGKAPTLIRAYLPKVKIAGKEFLSYAPKATDLRLDSLQECGNGSLFYFEKATALRFPKLERVGDYFLHCAPHLNELVAPCLREAPDSVAQIVQSVIADNRESASSCVASHPQRIATSEHPEIFNAMRREHCRE